MADGAPHDPTLSMYFSSWFPMASLFLEIISIFALTLFCLPASPLLSTSIALSHLSTFHSTLTFSRLFVPFSKETVPTPSELYLIDPMKLIVLSHPHHLLCSVFIMIIYALVFPPLKSKLHENALLFIHAFHIANIMNAQQLLVK